MTTVNWPRSDYSRVPYRLYHDQDIYEQERERIFRGPVWCYLGLEAEIPNPGDFRTTWLGDIPVVFQRDRAGELHAFVNRCAHRGAIVRRELGGNSRNHVCIYHRWCYNHSGRLTGVPLSKGIRGEGGLDADFVFEQHGLEPVQIASFKGFLFGTLNAATEPLEDYLGEMIREHLTSIAQRPLKILGYQRQSIRGNWKLYNENLRDTYHASLLHEFLVTFGIDRATQKGGVAMDPRHCHNLTYAYANSDSNEDASSAYGAHDLPTDNIKLGAPGVLRYIPEFGDGKGLAISSVFPNAAFQRLQNSLATRQVRPKAPGVFELVWTFLGYEDDDEAMVQHRLLQANLVGPAGLVSMEDAEAIEIVQRATAGEKDAEAVVEMGGKGPIRDCAFRVNDVPIRGFWSYWSELMDAEPMGAER